MMRGDMHQNPEPECSGPPSLAMILGAAAAWLISPMITFGLILWWCL